jgi:formylglycine-generating enzyme required for sulfatase activity
MRRHWSKLDDFGIQVEEDSGHWFILMATYRDGDAHFLKHPFKTFTEVLTVIANYLSRLRTKKLLEGETEIKVAQEDLSQEKDVPKDLVDKLEELNVYFSIVSVGLGVASIGLGIASLVRDNSNGQDRDQERPDQNKAYPIEDVIRAPRGGYELVRIPGGEFIMGSPTWEEGILALPREGILEIEVPQHTVTVPEFYMGRYPVTNEEYGRYLSENSGAVVPEQWGNRGYNHPRQPVVYVSWDDAQQYARWAGLRLPSEAQWEYACRAGTQTRFYSGNAEADLSRVGWYSDNSNGKHHPVGEKHPNNFGLYDMHGNVDEWVEDDWHNDYEGAPNDGSAWFDEPRGAYRVIRGGGFGSPAGICRSASRTWYEPGARRDNLGFRLVLLPGQHG